MNYSTNYILRTEKKMEDRYSRILKNISDLPTTRLHDITSHKTTIW